MVGGQIVGHNILKQEKIHADVLLQHWPLSFLHKALPTRATTIHSNSSQARDYSRYP